MQLQGSLHLWQIHHVTDRCEKVCMLTNSKKKIFQSTYGGLFIYMLCRSLRPNRKLGNSTWKSTWSFANGNDLLYVNFSSAKFSKYPSEKRSE